MKPFTQHRCPQCGDDRHLYGRADSRWNPDLGEWVTSEMEDEIECTECDWSGSIDETIAPSKEG